MSRPAPKMRLANIASGPKVPVTVAEWDATPGLHEWIEEQIAAAPARDARWSRLARQLLATHPYTHAPSKRGPGFYCDTCHVEDGVIEGGGNCDTVLALAEAYGLEPAGDDDVEVVQG